MKILLTGGNGMVGRNILAHKESKNYLILSPGRKDLDLLCPIKIDAYLQEHQPDFIIHAAGIVGGIEANIKEPRKFLSDNANIGLNLINSALKNSVDSFLNLGSSCMYPKNAKNPLEVSSILDGKLEPTNEGYALSKILALKLCEYISVENPKKNYKTIIPCNLYGKFDNFDPGSSHMIPAVIHKIYQAHINNISTVDIWGDGTARREFMLGSSFADFIFYSIKHFKKMPQKMNVGLGYDYDINNYYSSIAKVIGYEGKFINNLDKPIGMKRKLVNIDELSFFGWSNKISLEEGIQETFNYYKEIKHEI
jgi:nucleoside-diphosphate-sugar epimerase